jgi:hypothetical protein
MRTVTKSLMAISLSCLAEGLDEEAVDVENRAENRGKARREAMVYSKARYVEGRVRRYIFGQLRYVTDGGYHT